jgi:anti-sigma regulatory factor (Ser/Thr protein kinase)
MTPNEEAIFSECAEIALSHVGCGEDRLQSAKTAYNEACREIAEAIMMRASNRKTMDKIADAAKEEPK